MDGHIESHECHEEPAYIFSGLLIMDEFSEAYSHMDENNRCDLVEDLEALG